MYSYFNCKTLQDIIPRDGVNELVSKLFHRNLGHFVSAIKTNLCLKGIIVK